MQFINALSLAPAANTWLTNSRQPRMLHIFDHTCNLINERREVLSVVTRQIGNGPFNLVVEEAVLFSDSLSLHSSISFTGTQLHLGGLTIHMADAQLWLPRPDWERLHDHKDLIIGGLHLPDLPGKSRAVSGKSAAVTDQFSNALLSALASADLTASINAAKKLAGLGIGLTPAGDDFIIGTLYAMWIIHPPTVARVLAEQVANTAAPLTTSLSAAWLRAAGKGEAGILWHEFFEALISGNMLAIQAAMEKILDVGETSGADAMSGFIGVCMASKEKESEHENSSR